MDDNNKWTKQSLYIPLVHACGVINLASEPEAHCLIITLMILKCSTVNTQYINCNIQNTTDPSILEVINLSEND